MQSQEELIKRKIKQHQIAISVLERELREIRNREQNNNSEGGDETVS